MIRVNKPYEIFDTLRIVIPKEIDPSNIDLELVSRDEVFVVFREKSARRDLKLFKKPFIKSFFVRGEWVYLYKDNVYICDHSKCSSLYAKRESEEILDIIDKYLITKEDEKIVIKDLGGNVYYRSGSISDLNKVLFKDLSIALFKDKRSKVLFMNGKIYRVNNYCVVSDEINQLLAFAIENKIYVLYGSMYERPRYVETRGKNLSCVLLNGIGNVIIDNESTLIINERHTYEIPEAVYGVALLEDSIVAFNPSTKWLSRYFEKEIKYITKIEDFRDLRILGEIEDSLVIQEEGVLKMYKGAYSRIITKIRSNGLASLYKGFILIDQGEFLELINTSNYFSKKIPKTRDVSCVGYRDNIYCLDKKKRIMYKIDLLEHKNEIIGEFRGNIAVINTPSQSDVIDVVIEPSIVSRDDEHIYVYIPRNEDNKFSFEIYVKYLVGEYREKLSLEDLKNIISIRSARIEYSPKGIHSTCGSGSVFDIVFEVEEFGKDLVSKFNYLIKLYSAEKGIHKEFFVNGEDLVKNNQRIRYCVNIDVVSSTDLYVDLYIKNSENRDNIYLIDRKQIELVKRDIEISIDLSKEKLEIEVIDEKRKAVPRELAIIYGDYEYRERITERDYQRKYVLDVSDFINRFDKRSPVKIDLWVSDEEYVWGVSKRFILENSHEEFDLIDEKINNILSRIKISSKDRVIEDYELVNLPRERILKIKTSSEAYYVLYDGGVKLGKLSKGDNILILGNHLSRDYVIIKVFDGIHQENLVVRISDTLRDLVNAFKQGTILKQLLR